MKIIAIGINRLWKYGIPVVCVLFLLLMGIMSPWVYGGFDKKLPIYRVQLPVDDKRIAITFDCAWGAQDISELLEILEAYDAKATFFVLGTWAENNPEAMVAIATAGHEIGNHSYAHKAPCSLDEAALTEEIIKCNDAIYAAIGKETTLYRAPSGEYNDFVVKTAESLGFYMIQWDVDSIDWKPEMTKEAIYERVVSRTKPGSILLFHNDTKHTLAVLPEILQTLEDDGYSFVRVSELIYPAGYKIDANGEQQKTS